MKSIGVFCLIILTCSGITQAQTTAKRWSEADKQEIMTELAKSRQALLEAVKPVTEKQFFYRLDDKTWSPNDIIEHLGLIEEGYVREFWWALSQPAMPDAYRDSTAGDDQRAEAYATTPQKSEARGSVGRLLLRKMRVSICGAITCSGKVVPANGRFATCTSRLSG